MDFHDALSSSLYGPAHFLGYGAGSAGGSGSGITAGDTIQPTPALAAAKGLWQLAWRTESREKFYRVLIMSTAW